MKHKPDDWFSGPISLFYDLKLKIKDERLRQVLGGLILAWFGVACPHLGDLFADNQMAKSYGIWFENLSQLFFVFHFPYHPLILGQNYQN